MLTSLVISNLNITVSTTLKYCYNKALNKKLKLMGGALKYFSKKLVDNGMFKTLISRAMKIICKTIRLPLLHS